MQGIGSLLILDYKFLATGVGTLTVEGAQQSSVTFTGESMLYANATSNYGFAMLPRLGAFGGELPANFGMGTGTLPALIGVAEADTYAPPAAQIGFGMLPFLVSSGVVTSIGNGVGDAFFPALVGKGGEGYYGVGYGMLPPLFSQGEDDFTPGEVGIYHTLLFYNGIRAHQAHSQTFNTTGNLADDVEAIREQLEAIMEEMSSTGDITPFADFVASFTSQAYLVEALTALTTSRPSLDDTARTWAVDLESNASFQYDNFGFDSFFELNGRYYGVAEDGIYLLEGATDAGLSIQSEIDFGRQTFGTLRMKRVPRVYVGVGSDDKMVLKVVMDGTTRYYEAKTYDAAVEGQRFEPGRELKGTHVRLVLLNQDGADFDFDAMTFQVMELDRR